VSDRSDGDGLEALYLRHGPEALRLAYLLTGDRELSEDIAEIPARLPPGDVAVTGDTIYATDARGVIVYRLPAICS